LAEICRVLGEHCANTAMIYAMHQIQVASILRHSRRERFFEQFLRDVADRQLLLASATSEVGIGGDVRTSLCAVESAGGRFRVRKQAPVISYAEQADGFLVTARRHPDAAPSDQLMVVVRRDDTLLERVSGWDALGFRGTCSCGYVLDAHGDDEQILPDAYDEISSRTMLPFSHLLWSSLWLGMAADAVNRARQFVRDAARKKPGSVPAGATRLAETMALLASMRADIASAVREYESLYDDVEALSAMGFALRMNGLKVRSSQALVHIATETLGICGIAGYKADGKYSVERHLRDAFGAVVMISNDRILGASAAMLLIHRDE
jgi:acyl-CoA dehydrogenase